jgi:general secretion pathway protein N
MKLIRNLSLLALILLVLLALLLALFPARLAAEWAQPRLGALQLSGVSGTIWQGQAREARLHGQTLGTLGWRIHPWALTGMKLDADLSLQGGEFEGGGFVSAARGALQLRNGRLRMAAERMQPALDIPALNLRGTVEIALDEAEVVNGFPRRLQGSALWRNAAVDGAAAAQFGDLSAEFNTGADGALIGTVADQGGPLMLDGQFRLAFTGFEAEALLAARDGNPQVQEALQHIGEPQADGSSILQIRGQLLPLRQP